MKNTDFTKLVQKCHWTNSSNRKKQQQALGSGTLFPELPCYNIKNVQFQQQKITQYVKKYRSMAHIYDGKMQLEIVPEKVSHRSY